MKPFSCAMAAQRAGEDLIGTAGYYQTYVFIECPKPWAAKAFSSEAIPPALRQYVKVTAAQRSVQFLCINRGLATPPAHTTVLIYERIDERTEQGYQGYEFQLEGLDQVVPCLEGYWHSHDLSDLKETPYSALQNFKTAPKSIELQDILVCTHGMRDKCCAQFGQPFFREAKQQASQGHLPNMRIWQVSHMGGHRFAPTAISLPDGRYYGRLSLAVLSAIATRSGPIEQLRSVYRGWGMLPPALQVLERQLFLSEGWSWLDNQITYQLITAPEPNTTDQGAGNHQVHARLSVQAPDGSVSLHHAKLIQDPRQTYCLKTSCSSASPATVIKYSVAEYSVVKCVQRETASVI